MKPRARRTAGDLATLGSLLDPVRRSLYEHVARSDEPVSRESAAAAVGIGRPLAAFHLDKLVAAGLLEPAAAPSVRARARGRPSKLYRRRAATFEVAVPPRSYGLIGRIFARALARRWLSVRRGILAAARESGRDAARASGGARRGRESDALGRASRALAALGYEPKQLPGRIVLRNCPFDALARDTEEPVCAVNLALLQGLCSSLGGGLVPVPVPERKDGWCCAMIRSRG